MARSAAPKHANSLANELIAGDLPRPKQRKRKSLHDEDDATNATNQDRGYVDAKSSRKILKLGQDLADEEEQSQNKSTAGADRRRAAFEPRLPAANELEDDEAEEDDAGKWDDDEAWGDEDDVEQVEVDPQDLDTFNKFLPSGKEPTFGMGDLETGRSLTQGGAEEDDDDQEQEGTDLASLILQKIAEAEASKSGEGNGPGGIRGDDLPEEAVEIPPQVLQAYGLVGGILSRYKSGKLPKPVKLLNTLPHWQILLQETRPESWTPNAYYAVTKIFASSRPEIVREFYFHVLLPGCRENINDTKKLNVHLFKALQKATYKPAAFFRGLVFPLIESGTCTLREASIFSSVIMRSSIPPLHAGVAMLRLTDIAAEQASSMGTENSGATNMILTSLLKKGYALPYKVIDNLVFHFLRFRAIAPANGGDKDAMAGIASQGIEGKLPVLWHQCLLSFSQRYRNDITEDQREALLDLLQERGHKDIGPEVRRELLAGRGRGVVAPEEKYENGGDDTMDVA